MKYKVVSEFFDKFTKVFHQEGSVYETDSKERAEELQKSSFLGEEIEVAIAKKPAKKPVKGDKNESRSF